MLNALMPPFQHLVCFSFSFYMPTEHCAYFCAKTNWCKTFRYRYKLWMHCNLLAAWCCCWFFSCFPSILLSLVSMVAARKKKISISIEGDNGNVKRKNRSVALLFLLHFVNFSNVNTRSKWVSSSYMWKSNKIAFELAILSFTTKLMQIMCALVEIAWIQIACSRTQQNHLTWMRSSFEQ